MCAPPTPSPPLHQCDLVFCAPVFRACFPFWNFALTHFDLFFFSCVGGFSVLPVDTNEDGWWLYALRDEAQNIRYGCCHLGLNVLPSPTSPPSAFFFFPLQNHSTSKTKSNCQNMELDVQAASVAMIGFNHPLSSLLIQQTWWRRKCNQESGCVDPPPPSTGTHLQLLHPPGRNIHCHPLT